MKAKNKAKLVKRQHCVLADNKDLDKGKTTLVVKFRQQDILISPESNVTQRNATQRKATQRNATHHHCSHKLGENSYFTTFSRKPYTYIRSN